MAKKLVFTLCVNGSHFSHEREREREREREGGRGVGVCERERESGGREVADLTKENKKIAVPSKQSKYTTHNHRE